MPSIKIILFVPFLPNFVLPVPNSQNHKSYIILIYSLLYLWTTPFSPFLITPFFPLFFLQQACSLTLVLKQLLYSKIIQQILLKHYDILVWCQEHQWSFALLSFQFGKQGTNNLKITQYSLRQKYALAAREPLTSGEHSRTSNCYTWRNEAEVKSRGDPRQKEQQM